MNTIAKNTARPAAWPATALACLIASFFCCTGALAATHGPAAKKRNPNPAQSSAPRFEVESDLDDRERFLLLSVDGFSVTQTAFASARQCGVERKRTLQANPRLARYVARGEVDFECMADDASPDLPYEASIIEKSTGQRADLSMRTQAQCEIGMRNAKAAGKRYTILSGCHQRPWGQV